MLQIAAYCSYLASWLLLAITAIVNAIPKRSAAGRPSAPVAPQVLVGMLLQALSALPITLALPDGPLRPRTFELIGALVLAPLGAALFLWATRSAPRDSTTLVTRGAYHWLRHPIYLAFLAMLVATGLLASAGARLAVAMILYLTGSEIRIAAEESALREKFPGYDQYRLRTRWRYLPGLR